MNGFPVVHELPVGQSEDAVERLAALFAAHHDRLWGLARRLARDADEARDLVQETFLRAARSPRAVPSGASSEEAWLVRVLINIQRDQWRRTAVRARHGPAAAISLDPGMSGSTDPESMLIARTVVWRALDALPPRRRAIIVLRELEGLDIPAIASLLGVRAVTVRWHLSRARQELARALGASPGSGR